MKLLTIFLTACLIQLSARTSAQQVSYSAKAGSLKEAFASLEKQTGLVFFAASEDLAKAKTVTVEIKDKDVRAALDLLLKDQPLDYTIKGNTVFIKAKTSTFSVSGVTNVVIPAPPIDIHGRVIDSAGNPLAGASIKVKGTEKGVITDINGEFTIRRLDKDAVLIIDFVGYIRKEYSVNNRTEILISLQVNNKELAEVEIQSYSSGYQTIPKERATGSFEFIDNKLLNRSVSPDVLSRLDGVTNSLIFNKNIQPGANQSSISIRGRSTIMSNPNPLVVVDNFPYDGDINNINPNDVESITILKDAAAASIWGAFSGNGVIIITTKKGKFNQPLKVSVNTNLTVAQKPNQYYTPRLNSSDYIDVEQFLYSKGFFNSAISTSSNPISPAVEIMAKQASGQLSSAEATNMLNILRKNDVRSDINKYFYQPAINQQYSINISGGGPNNQFYFSTGFDNDLPSLKYNGYKRVTLNGSNTIALINHKLEVSTSILFTRIDSKNNNAGAVGIYPYLKYADPNGNALAVPYLYKQSYIDTAGQGRLLDWNYRPLDEIGLSNNNNTLNEYRANLSVKYNFNPHLNILFNYQYLQGTSANDNLQNLASFNTRNLINNFSQVNYSTGAVTYKLPVGAIMDRYISRYESNNGRIQANYYQTWSKIHELNAIVGFEQRTFSSNYSSYRLYGYDPILLTSAFVDYVNYYPSFSSPYGGTAQIPYVNSDTRNKNNFFSYFGNISYTYNKRYIVTGSIRRDEANLFGVNTNQKGVPLWSTGLAWVISQEKFYHSSLFPFLKFRLTEGYNGNINKSVSAYTTARSVNNNPFGVLFTQITNPPNNDLRWERVNTINIGIDFASKNNILEGSIEFYLKRSSDLIGNVLVAPQTGISSFTNNSANMKGTGIDLNLTSRNIDGQFKWYTTLLVNYANSKVTNYKYKFSSIGNYLSTNQISPLEGNPLYSLYSYFWAGLDASGNPQIMLDGKATTNYAAVNSSSNMDNLKLSGSSVPLLFGSLRNTVHYKSFTVSINIVGKFKYYFRKPSIYYSALYNYSSFGSPDFANRWQKSGDENLTNVPSMIYPGNGVRDQAYLLSDLLVRKGDFIRLQDIQISYALPQSKLRKLPFKGVNFYVYASNLGLIWAANKDGIDPDAVPSNTSNIIFPNPKNIAAGVKVDF